MRKNKAKTMRGTALLLAAVLLFSLCPAAAAAEGGSTDAIRVSTAGDLIALSKNCTLDTWSQGKTVELDADISLEGADFSPIPSFGGTFHGNGHTVSGLNLTGSQSHAGLFRTVQEGGTVADLNVSGTVTADGSEAAGGIAAVNYGTIRNCTFSGAVSGSASTGGIVGRNAVTGAVWSSRSSGSVRGDSMTGGVAGENLGLIAACTNAAYVNTTNQDKTVSAEDISLDLSFDMANIRTGDALVSAADSGGIAGYSSGVIRSCENTAMVGYPHVGYNVGGIVGRSCGYILSCVNSGAVYGRKDVGGVAGQMEPYIEMDLSQSTLSTLQRQLDELNALVVKAADDAEGGTAGVTSRLNSMSGYVKEAASEANDMRVVIDAGGSIAGSGSGSHQTDVTVTPGGPYVEGGHGSGASVDVDVSQDGVSIDVSKGEGGGVSAGMTPSDVDIDSSGAAGGQVTGAAQVVATPDLGGLTSAINGISSQLSQLNSAVSGAAGVLADDVRAINAKFSELSATLFDAVENAKSGDVISDVSTVDVDAITLGKAADSKNTAAVSGDINVGGVAGSMALEYALDPEDDVSSDISSDYRREYELKAVIQNCTNTGGITAKRSYAGGICGRMDLGLITGGMGFGGVTSENGSYVGGVAGLTGGTVRNSFAKCTLSGKKYVGGIVGSGITESLTGAVSTVSGCYSMVEITGGPEYAGAVSGAMAGDYLENRFVSDDLAGIDGQSYGGRAEPISYETLLAAEGLPTEMRTFTLRFTADDEVLLEKTFDYGASFSSDVCPDIPEKDGCYAVWDRTDLSDLHFDTVVSAVYIPYTTAVTTDTARESGRAVFLVEGDFDDAAALTAEPLAKDTTGFVPMSGGLVGAVRHYLSSGTWYRLPSSPINRDVTEQWHLTLPQDGSNTHKVHYLSPGGTTDNIRIYIRQDGGWRRADCEAFGSYLVFEVSGTEADIAAVTVLPVWWAWLIVGLLCLGLLILIILLIWKITKGIRRKRLDARARHLADEDTDMSAPIPAVPRKKRRWPWVVLAVILAVLAAAAACFFLFGGKKLAAYQALERLRSADELSMHVTVDVRLGDDSVQADTDLLRKTVDGRKIARAEIEGVSVYYADGAVILESGRAFRVGGGFPDYPALVSRLAPLYRDLSAERDGDAWTVTAEGDTARQLLTAVIPDLSDGLSAAQSVTVRVRLDGRSVQEVDLSAEGTLENGLPLSVSVRLDDITNSANFEIPAAVSDAAGSLDDGLPVITEDALTLLAAWQQWRQQDSKAAELALSADCGPVVVNRSFSFRSGRVGGQQVSCVSKDGLSIYWSGDKTVRQDGSAASDDERKLADSARLLDIVYLACQSGDFTKNRQGDTVSYTVELDGDTMADIAAAIAPDTAKLDLTFTGGSLTVRVTDGRLSGLSFRCAGMVKVVVLDTAASISGNIEFTDSALTLPESVEQALI